MQVIDEEKPTHFYQEDREVHVLVRTGTADMEIFARRRIALTIFHFGTDDRRSSWAR